MRTDKLLFAALVLYPILLLSWIVSMGQGSVLSRQTIFRQMGRQNTNAFLEDSRGFIWIGGSKLSRFDGHTIERYQPLMKDGSPNQMGTIHALMEDTQGHIWIGARHGLFYYDRSTDQLTPFPLVDGIEAYNSGQIQALLEDHQGGLWIGSREKLFYKKSPGSQQIQLVADIELGAYRSQSTMGFTAFLERVDGVVYAASNRGLWRINDDLTVQQFLPEKWREEGNEFQILDAATLDGNCFWLATNHGLWTFDAAKGSFTQKVLPPEAGKVLLTVLPVREGELWIGTQSNGLFKLTQGSIHHFPHQSDNPFSPFDRRIKALLLDRFNHLWIGTIPGVNRINLKQQTFPFYQITPGPYQHDNYVFRVMQDSAQGFWFRLLRQGLGYCAATDREVEYLLQPEASTKGEEIKHFCVDADGHVWVLTLTQGLFLFENGRRDYVPVDLGDSIRTSYPYAIRTDRLDERYLWFTSKYGLCRINRFNFERKWYYPKEDLSNIDGNIIGAFDQSEDGKIWCLLAEKDRKLICYFDRKAERFISVPKLPGHAVSLEFSPTYHIKALPGNRVWMTTKKQLVEVDASTDRVKILTDDPKFPLPNVKSVTPDLDGNIWFASTHKICRFDGENYDCHDARTDIEQFLYFSAALGSDGRVTFGGTNGLYSFYPENIKFATDTLYPTIFLSHFEVLNEVRHFGKAYELIEKMELPYNQNVVTFNFGTLHAGREEDLRFRHKLEPFEKEWIETDYDERRVAYTNLPPGTYHFQVIAAGVNDKWTPESEALHIQLVIFPPWYQTWWAYCLWLIISLGGLYTIYRFQLNRRLTKVETQRLRELDEVKTRFFTNITHEFRTPLTIILGLADKVLQKSKRNAEENVALIKQNGKKLLQLVNELLDLAKLESKTLPVALVRGDIIQYLRYLTGTFQPLAEERGLELRFVSERQELMIDFDPKKLESIVSNLLSNAIKFTPPPGHIQFRVADMEKNQKTFLEIQVADTGIGVSDEQIPYIFDRFYQIDGGVTRNGEGTGIGLALIREMVKLMGGSIFVESQLGNGTTFNITLPVTQNPAPASSSSLPKSTSTSPFVQTDVVKDRVRNGVSVNTKFDPKNPLLLIVEDNEGIIHYITTLLEQNFRLLIAKNGKDGWTKALENLPDLIVSDVMMPDMDGLELCHRLKTERLTCHIPIILLTAKGDQRSKITGLARGADAYMAKPFDEQELLIRIKHLLDLRITLQEKYQRPRVLSPISTLSDEPVPLDIDAAFLEEVKRVIIAKLDQSDLDVQMLCRLLGMSRTQLHRKLKALTGQSTTKFVKNVRMIEAQKLLLDSPMSIKTIAYEVGFKTPAYFCRVFSETFGCPPSEYRSRKLV